MSTITKSLPVGMKIGDTVHKDFELREPLVDDMIEAEKDADPRQIHSFNVALLTRIITRVGTFTGQVTPNMLKQLKRADYNTMVNALLEVEDQGEDQSGAVETSTAAS